MGTLFLLIYCIFFAFRMLCLKTTLDVIFMFALLILSVLNLFRERSKICHFLFLTGCSAMCALSLALHGMNTFFDPTYLTAFVLWLALLIAFLLEEQPCNSTKKTI